MPQQASQSSTPPLPPGYTLDSASSGSTPPLPPGYTLDSQGEQPHGFTDSAVQWLKNTFAPRQVPQQKPTGEMPGSFEGHPENIGEYVPRTAGEMASGVKDIAHGDIAKGAHRVISGAGEAAAPFLPMVAAAAPAAVATSAATGTAGQQAGKFAAKALGASEDQSDLAGDVAGIGSAYAGAKVGPYLKPVAGALAKGYAKKLIPQEAIETYRAVKTARSSAPDPALAKSSSLADIPGTDEKPASQTGEALGQPLQRGSIAEAMKTPETTPAAQQSAATPPSPKPITRGSLSQMMQEQLEKGLGATPRPEIKPGVPIRQQMQTPAPSSAPDLPEGHFTGLGPGEILSLKLKHVRMSPAQITVPRSGAKRMKRERSISLNAEAATALEMLTLRARRKCLCADPEHYLIPRRNKDHSYDPTRPGKGWRGGLDHLLGIADIKIRCYDFRHHAVSKALRNPDVSPEGAKAYFGWVNPRMFERYGHMNRKTLDVVAAAMSKKPVQSVADNLLKKGRK